ncbi:beta-1,3-galactosyl-O-glycosyl-glycoprotein beta-1,6-N-acetylglucosaminyltransferase 3, partial [Octopus bimaculoides]|uniref:beta-1,3-galactosyl-O-glycosyl-glycoprotein beta-1,6-N-acetylglucosaminyltransferase 3 n=1 Tax=Octopus bimaculoides TaxID=37653 RepID=UPI00071E5261
IFEFRTKYRYAKFRQIGLKSPPPHNIKVSKGSVHIVASRGYIEFLIMDRRSQDFTKWVRDTRNPDETLFSTMNHNPHLRVPGSFNEWHYNRTRDEYNGKYVFSAKAYENMSEVLLRIQ